MADNPDNRRYVPDIEHMPLNVNVPILFYDFMLTFVTCNNREKLDCSPND